MITNSQSRTNIQEIADGIYRINTPVDLPGGGAFSLNQYLVVDEAPLLFHTGPRQLFPLVHEAIAAVMPVERLRYIGLSHFEADESGAQPGHGEQALTEGDIFGPSEGFRQPMDYFAHGPNTADTLLRLARTKPRTLACMHGSAWQGDGGSLLRQLAEALTARA